MARLKITARDVAQAASVSIATVSLVVNGKADGRVPPETRQRVLEAAQTLGYTVDRRARGLATGKSGLIGFVVPGMRNPFFSLVHMALLREFGSLYQVLTVTTDMGESATRNIDQLSALGVDAIVGMSIDNAYFDALKAHVPLVLVDTNRPGPGVAAINFTDEAASRDLAAHLVGLGHRRVAYLDAARGGRSRELGVRRTAFAEALLSAGAEPLLVASAEVDIDLSAETVRTAAANWRRAGITALVCATDLQAYGALVALRQLRIGVPGDMSLAGFDDLPFSKVMTPELTTVHVPAARLAAAAAAELRKMLGGEPASTESITIPIELKCRASTGPAPVTTPRR